MQYLLQLFQQNRKNIIHLLESHSLDQINAIPVGFNNNLIWNAGHALLAQQFLVYHFSGVPVLFPLDDFVPKYGSDTVPDGKASQEDVDQLIGLLKSTSDKMVEDYQNDVFKSYSPYSSEYFGISMNNIEEAIQFNTYHEGFHFGCMSKIKMAIASS